MSYNKIASALFITLIAAFFAINQAEAIEPVYETKVVEVCLQEISPQNQSTQSIHSLEAVIEPQESTETNVRDKQTRELLSECTWAESGAETTPILISVYENSLILSDKDKEKVIAVLTAETGGYYYDDRGIMVDRILVAQCIREDIESSGKTISDLANGIRYAEPVYEGTSSQSELAYDIVFGDGNGVVACGIKYFYNPKYGVSIAHENQEFIVETSLHRYFRESEK